MRKSPAPLCLVLFLATLTAGCVADQVTEPAASFDVAPNSTVASSSASDRDALVALYEATDGDNWDDNTGWLTEDSLHLWRGAKVDSSGAVTSLSLYDNNLTGQIPPELGNLSELDLLNLGDNALTGEIPPELGNLNLRRTLSLAGNALTGDIPPELGNLSKLDFLNLGDNALTGEIPPELGDLAALEGLRLSGNDLTGQIPPELGDLADLRSLDLDDNDLTGEIPPELGDLADLRSLDLDDNDLTGEIPPELGDLADLRSLDLDDNALTGEIPPELGDLADLSWLSLSGNDLTGEIPPELVDLELASLDLSDNLLTGEIPDLPTVRRILDLSGNRLTGEIPRTLSRVWRRDILDLSDNLLTGEIPPELGALNFHAEATGTVLNLSHNLLTGEIPPELGDLTVEGLYLASNLLTGEIPPELGNLSPLPPDYRVLSEGFVGLHHLDVGYNPLEGPVPLALAAGLDLDVFRYVGTEICVQEPGQAMRNWLDSIPRHVGTGLRCVPSFGDGFETAKWPPPDWVLINAGGEIESGALSLSPASAGKVGYLARGHTLTQWEGRASMESDDDDTFDALIFFMDHFRYRAYGLRIGPGAYPSDGDTNYMLAVLDALEGTWKTNTDLYGTTDAIKTGAFAELSASMRDSVLTVYAGSTELISVETGPGLPVGLLGYAVAAWPSVSDTVASSAARFDWFDVYGSPPPAPSASPDHLSIDVALPAIGEGVRQLPDLFLQRR